MLITEIEYTPLVLIVDDSTAYIHLLAQALDNKYRIKFATSGYTALELIKNGVKPDLILLDVMMPDMDGYEACRHIHGLADCSNIPIIFITAKDDSRNQIEGFKCGGVDYITKPFDPEIVRARVHSQISLRLSEQQLRESRAQIRALSSHQEKIIEQERKKISREIHDELGQLLSAIRLQLHFIKTQLSENPASAIERVHYISSIIDQTQKVAKNIVSSLRPAALELGIVSALEWQAEEFSKHTGIQCKLTAKHGITMSEHKAITVFRIVQESLTNIMRHAKNASEVEILLNKGKNNWSLRVSDNGIGFSFGRNRDPKSFGLIGIQERARLLGGSVTISSTPNKGVVLDVSIPVMRTNDLIKP